MLANRYVLEDPEIQVQWGRDFPCSSTTALGPFQPPIKWYRISFPRVKRAGGEVKQPPPSNDEVKEMVAL